MYYFDGRWRRGEGAVPLSDRLFRFGDGCFETVRVEDGEPRHWPLHMKRLHRSLKQIGLPVITPDIFPLPRLPGVAALRMFFSGGLGSGLARLEEPAFYASVRSVEISQRALKVRSYVRADRAFADVKTPSYLEAIVALKKQRADDLIATDAKGNVLESATGNVFASIRGKWLTPPLDGRILPGVTREVLMRFAAEKRLTLAELKRADAVVLTSALRGITPVVAIDGVKLGRGETLTRALMEAYRSQG